MIVSCTIIAVWILRLRLIRGAFVNDALGLAVTAIVKYRSIILAALSHVAALLLVAPLPALTAVVFLIAIPLWIVNLRSRQGVDGKNGGSETRLQPILFPCRTTHSRLYPQTHSFAYSYLYAGIPVGWGGRAGTLLSAENYQSHRRPKTWFSVEAEDYLARGSHPKGLAGKLEDFLSTQSIKPQKYSQAYLVTAPRFLGYAFNPVSFWYLYDEKEKLSAMILEVNNTFDERRPYLLQRDSIGGNDGSSLQSASSFSHAWPKDFHVSPFNDRQGLYAVKAINPFAADGNVQVDCNITLSSAEGKPKLVARVFSAANPVLPNSLSVLLSLKFVLAWWWVGLTTDVRILREARKLWMKGLEVFYRPEVFVSSIGRRAAAEEEIVEKHFRMRLREAVDSAPEELSIEYTAAINSTAKETFTSCKEAENLSSTLQIRILSPAFYRGLIYSTGMAEVFENGYFEAPESARLATVSNPTVLRQLLKCSSKSVPLSQPWNKSWLEYAKAALKIWISDKAFFGSLALLDAIFLPLWVAWLCFGLGALEQISKTLIYLAI